MPVFSQALFALVLSNFCALSFFTAWHKTSPSKLKFFVNQTYKIRIKSGFINHFFYEVIASFTDSLKSLEILRTGTYCSGTITSTLVFGFRATR